MSEKIRKAAGTALIALTAAVIAAGCFRAGRTETRTYRGNGYADRLIPSVTHLTEDSLINTGDPASLEKLPGVGPVTAEAILKEREENGLFIYPEDLISVYGIGESKMIQIRDALINESGESEE